MCPLQLQQIWWSENSRHILLKKVLLMTHLPISSILNAAVQMTSSRNSGWARWLIYWLWHTSQKQKAPFPQEVTTIDHQNPAPNHSQNVTKYRKWRLVTHLVMSPGSFNVSSQWVSSELKFLAGHCSVDESSGLPWISRWGHQRSNN